ncbi:hypothetical protein TRFO_02731 [Tritrichomonas foetus]|uniref:Uncharacterized protein n=1 Tax=Tritrichomonas foetus TaxID=1144522 RepID=A0A1J4L3B0_9EUKA|nr:hypothetical protein TRFO_02731 [Tritrichomonas foetus]|eukprot:OHT16460.1 hypothetical protein TRFO_02731 [Tritrichomonas foetus]
MSDPQRKENDGEKLKWLTRRISTLKRTGQLILANEKLLDINSFSQSQELLSNINLLKVLDIRGTNVSTLEGLPYIPNLNTFLADSTQISTFINFKSIRNASKVSFKKTPLTQYPKYKLALLVLCGNKLTTIDNAIIPKTLRSKSEKYPPIAIELIDRGWIIESPCPDEDRFNELAIDYELVSKEKEEDNKLKNNQQTDYTVGNEDIVMEDEEENFDQIIQSYHQLQDAMFIAAEALFDIVPERNIEAELAEEISILFGSHGIAVDANNDELVLQAVEDLCRRATSHGDTPSSITEEEEV